MFKKPRPLSLTLDGAEYRAVCSCGTVAFAFDRSEEAFLCIACLKKADKQAEAKKAA